MSRSCATCRASRNCPLAARLAELPEVTGAEVAGPGFINLRLADSAWLDELRAIAALGGTITHHHAVGADHRPWMREEVGELGVQVLQAVKATLDPAGILNPGKLIP